MIAVEHDPEWAEKISNVFSPNVQVVLREPDDYADEVLKHGLFDVIVIDGINRVDCVKTALNALTSDGVIIWDDSNRSRYINGVQLLLSNGFCQIDFKGMGPINPINEQTSIYYRAKNCVGI